MAADLELGEAAEVEHADPLAHRPALLSDRPEPVGATEARALLGRLAFRHEPGGALPAAARAEHGALRPQRLVQGRRLGRPPGRALLERQRDRVLVLVQLACLGAGVRPSGVVGVAARIEAPQVPLRLAFRDPFGHRLAGAARLHDAEAERAAEIIVGETVRRPDQRIAIRRVRDRAVDHARDPRFAEHGHARHRVLDVGLEPVEIVGEQLPAELGRRLLAVPGEAAVPFVGPEQQPGAFLAQVPGDVRVAHDRQRTTVLRDLGDRRGDQILVLHRDHRQVQPGHAPDLARPVAGGVDHDLAGDRAGRRADAPLARGGARDTDDRHAPPDFGAGGARSRRQRLGHLAGVDVAVVGIPEAAEQVVGLQERMARAHFVLRQDLEGEALGVRHADDVTELFHALPGVGEPDAAARAVIDGAVDLAPEPAIQPVAVALQLHDVPGGREVRAVAGGVPGRARGQLVTLEQHRVAPAHAGQVVQHAAADDAATDHHHARMRFHASLTCVIF